MRPFLIWLLFLGWATFYQWQHPPSPAEQKAYQEYLDSDQYQQDIANGPWQEEPDWDYEPGD